MLAQIWKGDNPYPLQWAHIWTKIVWYENPFTKYVCQLHMNKNFDITKCNICTNILCSLLIIAIESETVFANNKRCSGELFRLKPWFAHTKAICMQHCNDNAECNFYAYWSGGAGHGDCRGWTTCPSLENLSSAYKNTVYRVDRTTSGAIIINKFFNKRLCKCPQYIH